MINIFKLIISIMSHIIKKVKLIININIAILLSDKFFKYEEAVQSYD